MVSIAALGVPTVAPPVGVLSLTVNVSAISILVSSVIGTSLRRGVARGEGERAAGRCIVRTERCATIGIVVDRHCRRGAAGASNGDCGGTGALIDAVARRTELQRDIVIDYGQQRSTYLTQ